MRPEVSARHRAISTLMTSLGQLSALLAAGLLGVLIAHRFGSNARTDGFFAANSIYGIGLFVATSLRTTAIPRLVAGAASNVEFSRHLRAVGVLAVAAAGVFGVLALAVVPVVTSSLPSAAEHTARVSLAVLWPACALQLFSGLAAAKLAVLDDYRAAALAYGAGAGVNLVAFLAASPALGVPGVPVALLTGAVATAAILGVALRRRGVRIVPGRVDGVRRTAGRLALGAAALVSAQAVLAVSVALAAHTGQGQATLYSYAMMAILVLSAALVSPITIVFAPVVARAGARRSETLAPLSIRAVRASGLLTPVAVAGVVLLGRGPAGVVLNKLSSREVNELFRLVLILAPSLVAAQLVMIPLLGVLSDGRLTALAGWSLAAAAWHTAATATVVVLGGRVELVAAVAVVSSFVLAAITNILAFRRMTAAVTWLTLRSVAAFVVPGGLVFIGGATALDAQRSFGRGVLTWTLGTAVYGAWMLWRHGAEVRELAGMLRQRAPSVDQTAARLDASARVTTADPAPEVDGVGG